MTILPNCQKKKSQQQSGNGEIENGDSNSSGGHHSTHQHQLSNISSLPSHISQNGEGTSLSALYLSSQSPPPCWSPPGGEEKRASHSSPSHFEHYDDSHDSSSSLSKRRYRASPLRSVRPKLREHRGNTSPSYHSSNGSELWNMATVNQHSLGHSLQLPIPASSLSCLPSSLSSEAGPSHMHNHEEDTTAYNSGDEYESFGAWKLTKEQWEEKERWFEKKIKKKRRLIKKTVEDGACLFRAVADQVYGDQDMHQEVRRQCMDYLERNEDAFAPFVSESFDTYIERKRRVDCHGNHIEIAAMSEMYNRVIEVYCYGTDPINIFQGSQKTDNAPIRLTYHKGTHYNSLVDPYQPTIGVGLGLPSYQPGLADKNLMNEATRQSENLVLEKAMLEDKIRATDFEATSEAIEEQVAQQSYMEWLREEELRRKQGSSSSETPKSPKENIVTDGSRMSPRTSSAVADSVRVSPRRAGSPPSNLPQSMAAAGNETSSDVIDLAVPGSSKDPMPSSSRYSQYDGFILNESASFLNDLPSDIFGLTDYANEEAEILARVLAASQQEYLDSLKKHKNDFEALNSPENSSSS